MDVFNLFGEQDWDNLGGEVEVAPELVRLVRPFGV
jgi:hypothetical protein